MEKIYKAKARRSGGRITITGFHPSGIEAKIPNVDTIDFECDSRQPYPVATDKNGVKYALPPN